MPRQNRVTPTADFIVTAARGNFMGNRGILHDAEGSLTRARWRHQAWVTCVLCFKGRRRKLMSPGKYTELFFLDEAVAFAAGHRPCSECRRAAYLSFRSCLTRNVPIKEIDKELHAQRAIPREYTQRRHQCDIAELPVGTFVLSERGEPMLLGRDSMRGYRPEGYKPPVLRAKSGTVTVLTPPMLIDVLRAGYSIDTGGAL